MKEYEVNCVTRQDDDRSHAGITHIGHLGHRWRVSLARAVLGIEARTDAFFFRDPATGRRIDIGVIREPGKPPYLRACADGHWNDQLLGLPGCGPVAEA